MTEADRVLLGMIIVIALGVFILASGSRSAPLRILGYFLAASAVWAGVAYAYTVLK